MTADEYDEWEDEEEYPEDEEEYPEDDGHIYHDEDDEMLSDRERRDKEILKVHPFLKRRRVTVMSCAATRGQGWTSRDRKKYVGKTGVVVEVHNNVTEAVKVQIDGTDDSPDYWHFSDLQMCERKIEPSEPVFFNPLDLVV